MTPQAQRRGSEVRRPRSRGPQWTERVDALAGELAAAAKAVAQRAAG